MALTAAMVRQSQSDDDPWRVGNQLLYDLCRQHPRHVVDAEIVAKVWLIGRAYSASLERGRDEVVGSDVTNDGFYTEHVTRVLRNSSLDKRLKALERVKHAASSIGRLSIPVASFGLRPTADREYAKFVNARPREARPEGRVARRGGLSAD